MRLSMLAFALTLAVGACGSDDDSGDGSGGSGAASSGGGAGTGGGDGGSVKLECDPYCQAVLQPGCPSGPPDIASCRDVCQQIIDADSCPALDAFLQCAGTSPRFVCDQMGSPIVEGCETEMEAVGPCFQGQN